MKVHRWIRFAFTIQWDQLHFCKADKVRYRKHLTIGMFSATVVGMVGTHFGNAWLADCAAVANLVTAIIWIWE